MLRVVRRLLLTLLILLALVIGLAVTLTASEPGSRWLLRQALQHAPGELRVEAIHGRLSGHLQLQNVDYRREQLHLHADRLALRWRPIALLHGRVHILQLQLQNLNVDTGPAATENSQPFSAPERIPLPLTIALDELQIDGLGVTGGGAPTQIDSLSLAARAGPLQGLLITKASISQQHNHAELSGHAALQQPYTFNAQVDWQAQLPDAVAASGHARLEGDIKAIGVAHTLRAPFHFTTLGRVQLEGSEPVMSLHGQWRDLHWPLAGAPAYRSARGEYRLEGTLAAYRLSLNGQLRGAEIPAAQLQASAHGNLEGLHLESLTLDTLGGGISAGGDLAWAPHFSLGLSIRATQIEPGKQWPVGAGKLDLSTFLKIDSRPPSTRVALRQLDLRGTLRDQPVTAKGSLRLQDGVVSTPGLNVHAGANRVNLSGAFNASGVQFDLDAPELATLLPGLGGRVRAHGTLTGPLQRLGGQVELTANALSYAGNRAGTLQLSARLAAARPQSLQLEMSAERLLLGSRAFDRLTLRGDGTLDRHQVRLQLQGPTGGARLSAAGGYANALWSGNLASATLELPELGTWRLRQPVALRLTAHRADPFAACWSSADRDVCLRGEWSGDQAQLHLDGKSSQGHARGAVEFSGLLGARPRLEGQIDADIPDIRFLDPLVPKARVNAGRVNAELRLGGYLDAPKISGEARLAGGELGIAELGLTLSAIELQASGDGTRLKLTGSAHSGEGKVALSGALTLDPQQQWPFDVQVQGERFAISQLPDMEITANPDLQVKGSARRAAVSGSILIPHAHITLKELPPDVVKVSPDQVLIGTETDIGAAPGTTYPVSLNVVVTLGDDVRFEGLGLSTELGGSLNVRSLQTDTLIGNGVLELHQGRYEGYGQKLAIEQGRLLFAGPLNNPALDVRATRTVNGVVAGIQLYGNADAPQTRLFSEPAMSDAQIMSYLVTGKPLGASRSSSDSQALAAAAASLGANSPVGQELSQLLGIEIGVQSGATDSDTSLVVSKRLSSRLSVDYVYGMFNQSAAIRFIYELTEHLSLTGQSGAVQSIDLEYTISRP